MFRFEHLNCSSNLFLAESTEVVATDVSDVRDRDVARCFCAFLLHVSATERSAIRCAGLSRAEQRGCSLYASIGAHRRVKLQQEFLRQRGWARHLWIQVSLFANGARGGVVCTARLLFRGGTRCCRKKRMAVKDRTPGGGSNDGPPALRELDPNSESEPEEDAPLVGRERGAARAVPAGCARSAARTSRCLR